jgi:2-phospho-L-lactate/phosphoenolpyruvate guanylyltransferase
MAPDKLLTWSLVIPVKVLAQAKSRLVGLAGEDRAALVLAMAADTVAAAMACPSVAELIVVTDDPAVRRELASAGALVIADQPRSGLNQALMFGAEHAAARWPDRGRAALIADLPALTSQDLTTALAAAAAVTEAFVADAAGSGTTLYTATPGERFRPRFGALSRDAHLLAGVTELDLPASSGLRQDVDTLGDLRSAARLGLGRRTAGLLARAPGPETAGPETARPETARPETARPETARPETARPETARPETARPETARQETDGQAGGGNPPGARS